MTTQDRALLRAASAGDKAEVELLLLQGANVNARSSRGWTPLHKALYSGHSEVACLLLKHGADAEAKTCIGWTPLHQAASRGLLEIVRLLVETYGASPNELTGDKHKNAAELAMGYRYDDVVMYLMLHMIRH